MICSELKSSQSKGLTRSGFALPTVLIASMVMLMVLLASVASTTAIRVSLSAQYYNSLAQTASESGVAYAKACLAANSGVAQWSDSSPLKPDTNCAGAPLAGCSSDPSDNCHYIVNNGNAVSTFTVGLPQSGNITSNGVVKLVRTSDQSFWRQFAQSSRTTISSLTSAQGYGDGVDGAVAISANKNINSDTISSGRITAGCADGINYAVTALTANTATLSSTPAAGCLSVGDEILIINMQGITTNPANIGNYEALRVLSVATNVVTFKSNKTKYYGNDSSNDSNIGVASTNQRVMLQRIPNYTDVTINNGITLTANAWDSSTGKGGLIAFRANNSVTNNGTITASGLGNMYGAGGVQGCSYYAWPTVMGDHGASVTGDNSTTICARKALSYSSPFAPNLGGGGGGAGSAVSPKRNGGGGGGATYGTVGTAGSNSSTGEVGGAAGSGYGNANLVQLFVGSGGGGGGRGVNASGANGGRGGGIVLISASLFTNSGSVSASGLSGSNAVSSWDDGAGGGGGGSGGSIVIQGGTLTIGSSLVTSAGGAGGTKSSGANGMGGNGGAGGVGRIGLYSQNAVSGTSSPTFTLLPSWYF